MVKNGFSRCAPSGIIWNDGEIGSACPIGQMQATFYNNRTLSGNPTFWRCESVPFNDWGGGGPGNGVGNDNFSVRWAGQYDFNGTRHRFTTRTDDGVRLWLDATMLIDHWVDMPASTYYADKVVSGRHTPMMEYYENGGGAVAQLNMANNLAQWRPAYATSQEGPGYEPAKGNDGNLSTRWSSSIDNQTQWWWVDLGTQTFSKVVIRWEAAYAPSHFVGWSNDGVNFTGYWYNISSPGAYAYNLGTNTAKYVGIYMATHASCCGNFSFWESEVYHTGGLSGIASVDEIMIGEGSEMQPVGGLETLIRDTK
jgi:hypothetical protein